MAEKKLNSLDRLKDLKIEPGPKPAAKAPEPVKTRADGPGDRGPDAADETGLFRDAMRGVTPLERDAGGRQVSDRPAPAPLQPPAPGAREREYLDSFMRGEVEFELEFSDEYLYGFVRGLDMKIFQRLKAGALSPEAHLDLHGQNSDQARENLLFFVRESYLQGRRCLLLVTGRGRNSPGGLGIIRREIKVWLTGAPLRRVVLAFCTALPKHGGTGALYVLLRKKKKTSGKVNWDWMAGWEDAGD
ncbi:MAG: Smr/MutS family protein [Desulfovibrionaceae bacterium]|nr:Smr/MutS family protein [Desulfovibrionaceae bacterium]